MALRMASEMTEPVLDLESSIAPVPVNTGRIQFDWTVFHLLCINSLNIRAVPSRFFSVEVEQKK